MFYKKRASEPVKIFISAKIQKKQQKEPFCGKGIFLQKLTFSYGQEFFKRKGLLLERPEPWVCQASSPGKIMTFTTSAEFSEMLIFELFSVTGSAIKFSMSGY